jgi:hypothetical protein
VYDKFCFILQTKAWSHIQPGQLLVLSVDRQ